MPKNLRKILPEKNEIFCSTKNVDIMEAKIYIKDSKSCPKLQNTKKNSSKQLIDSPMRTIIF